MCRPPRLSLNLMVTGREPGQLARMSARNLLAGCPAL
jgi:hypothetical protein